VHRKKRATQTPTLPSDQENQIRMMEDVGDQKAEDIPFVIAALDHKWIKSLHIKKIKNS
jgi:hypothetical protein